MKGFYGIAREGGYDVALISSVTTYFAGGSGICSVLITGISSTCFTGYLFFSSRGGSGFISAYKFACLSGC